MGTCVRGLTFAKTGGSNPSRLIAKNTRLWPIIKIKITVVRPAIAPSEINVAKPGRPTDRNASANGASILSLSYFTMPVTTRDTDTYRAVQMPREARIPIGMSRWGSLVSSAAVATMSKPMKAKKTSAAPVKMPLIPKDPGENPRSCNSDGVLAAPAAVRLPLGGMNGDQFDGCT